ncbi:ABC transporter permease [Paenarthrobacter sp. Z7-10]|uniref:ABC transporter permease n=1 Tax=Paenarthrobacter sp. Z7-10 TaxID=2787635 RepID=UPI0022A92DB4|nr:ABC transporter permease [Paenarthrobacter sp. Z7-10]MCZ2401623.1 ABC transporter permease [Paenarthrobacter sp. Z7-10]
MSGFWRYMGRRVAASVVTLLGVILVLVTLFKFVPGDPARIIAGLQATPEQVEAVRKTMGLEQPVIVQFWQFLEKLGHGNMGVSARTGTSVISEIGQRLPYTLELAVLGTLFGAVAGILLGVFAARHKGKLIDTISSMVGVMGISMPVYWLGILLIMLFSVQLRMLPIGGAANLQSLVMPTVTLGVFSMAIVSRMTRSTMLDSLMQDYVRTARAKGVRESLVVYQHALRNAFIPVLTVIGLQFGTLLGGAVLTETVFAWPGLGRLLVDSINSRDFPMVQGIVLTFATMFIVVNIITDLLYSVIDPRVRLYD